MDIQKALKLLKERGFIQRDDSTQAASIIIRDKELSSPEVAGVLRQILNCDSYSEEFITKDQNNVQREREIYNRYMLAFLISGLIRARTIPGLAQFSMVCQDAAQNAIHATTERLYGPMKWMDNAQRNEEPSRRKTGAVIQMDEEEDELEVVEVEVPVVVVPGPKKPRGEKGRVTKIYARIVDLYVTEKKTRQDTLDGVIQEFGITNHSSAITFFNSALASAGVPKEERHRGKQ